MRLKFPSKYFTYFFALSAVSTGTTGVDKAALYMSDSASGASSYGV